MNRMLVATFSTRSAAEPVRQRLIDRGLLAEIHDELKLAKFWFVSRPQAGARIEVPADQFERAHSLMLQWDAEGALPGAVHCPECRSLRVMFPQYTRQSIIPNIIVGALSAIGRVPKEYYCEDCHYTWPKAGARVEQPRPHSAPNYFIEGTVHPPSKPGEHRV